MIKPEIRLANLQDARGLKEIYVFLSPDAEQLPDAQFEAQLASLLPAPNQMIIVVAVGSVIASTCTLYILPNLNRSGSPMALVENVVTHEKYRRLGFGKLVLKDAVARAQRAGCYKVMLLTGSQNQNTHNFYQNAGFEQSKTGYQIRL